MNNVIYFRTCSRCGAILLTAVAVCNCVVRRDDQAHTEQMPLSPPIVIPVVTQTSTGMLANDSVFKYLTKS